MPQKEIILQEIGKRILDRRKQLGLTQEALAEKAEVTTQFVSYAESGKRAMRPENLLKISEALGVSADYLLTGDMIDKDSLLLSEKLRLPLKLYSGSDGMHVRTDENPKVFVPCYFCRPGANARGETRKNSKKWRPATFLSV